MRNLKILSLLAALLFSAGMYVQAEIASGTCGTNLNWSLSDDYALTFSGTGTTMNDYSPASPAPWAAYKASIVSITLPETLSKVGAYAFAGCDNVATLTLPESVYWIGVHALDMASLASLYVMNHSMPPSRGQEAYSEIFPGHAANLKIYFHLDMVEWFCQSWVPYIHYLMPYDYIAEVESPSSMPTPTASGTCGTNVNWALYGGTLTISGPGTVMDDFANANAQPWAAYRDNIGTVHIEGRITNVGNYAFAACNKVGWIFLPDALTTIGSHAFDGCRKLEYARSTNPYPTMNGDIPEGVTSIGDAAFYNCDNYYEYGGNYYGFKEVSLPSTLTSLGANNFVGCSHLVKVTMNATTPPALGSYTEELGNVHIWVPNASAEAYANAENWVDLWDNLYDNTDMHLPLPAGSGTCGSGVSWEFEMQAAAGAPGRRNALPATLSDYKGTLTISGSGAMEDYAAASAPWHAYKNATSYIELSEGLTKIGNNAFDDFGDNVEAINCEATTPPTVGNNAFGDIPATTPVTVPAAAEAAYQAVPAWNNYESISGGDPLDPENPNNPGTYQLTLNMSIEGAGVLTGAGLYAQGTEVEIEAVENDGYTFVEWSDGETDAARTITMINRDSTLTAIFEVNSFTITFEDEDGTEIASAVYNYGEMPEAPADPTKADDEYYSYTFAGWDPEIEAVTEDATYTATYNETFIGVETVILSYLEDASYLSIGSRTNIIVTGTGHLVVDELTTAKSLTIEYDSDYSGQVTNIEDLSVERVEITLSLDAVQEWQAFAVPFAVSVASGIRIEGAESAARYGYDFIIDEYDGNLRATKQDGWKRVAADATLQPGKLYMIYTASATIWTLTAANPASLSETAQVAVAAYPSAIGAHHAGWNGIANTLYREAEASLSGVQYITTYDNFYGVYDVQPISDVTLNAGKPFFVQAPAAGTVLFAQVSGAAPRYMQTTDEPLISCVLSLASDDYTDKAYLNAQADKEDVYTIGHDLLKMQSANASVPQLWLEGYNSRLAAYELPLTGTTAIVPLGLYAPQAGEYTLNADTQTDAYTLTLLHNGTPMAELGMQPFVLALNQGEQSGYALRITKRADVVTGLSNTTDGIHAMKFVDNGMLYILLPDGSKFSATGAKTK